MRRTEGKKEEGKGKMELGKRKGWIGVRIVGRDGGRKREGEG